MFNFFSQRVPLLVHNPAYRNLWLARAISQVGDTAGYVALMLFVRELTGGSGMAMALLAVAEGLPALLFGPLAGLAADRFRRTRVMIASDLASAALFCLLPFVTTAPQVYLVAVLTRLAFTFFSPARSALVPDLVRQDELTAANALGQATFSATLIIGPLIGAGLVGLVGYDASFVMNAVSFLVSAVFVARIQVAPRPTTERKSVSATLAAVRGDLTEGWQALTRSAQLVLLFVADQFGAITFAAFTVLEVLFVKDVLQASDQQYGLLIAVCGLGGVVGSALLGRLERRWRPETVWSWAFFLGALTFFPYANSRSYPFVLAVCFVQMLVLTVWNVGQITLLQRDIPEAVRGRVFGLFEAPAHVTRMSVVFVFGWLVDVVGVVAVFNLAGVVATVGAVYLLARAALLAPIAPVEPAVTVEGRPGKAPAPG